MSKKRMFSLGVLETDAFLDMPLSAQALYFHLNLRADDDGFVGNPKRITQSIGANLDDLKLLVAKRFLIAFEDGVIVIKHWRMHNAIKKDRYTRTNFTEDLQMLHIKDNGSYTLKDGTQMENKWNTNGEQMLQTSSTGKVRLGKVSIVKENYQKKAEEVAAYWNEKAKTCSIRPMQKLTGKRITALKERLKDYSVEDMNKAIDRIVVSDFCNGKGERGWKADIDFLLRPDTITKILEGKYDNQTTTFASYEQRTESDSNSLKGFRINKTNVTAEEIRKRLDNH